MKMLMLVLSTVFVVTSCGNSNVESATKSSENKSNEGHSCIVLDFSELENQTINLDPKTMLKTFPSLAKRNVLTPETSKPLTWAEDGSFMYNYDQLYATESGNEYVVFIMKSVLTGEKEFTIQSAKNGSVTFSSTGAANAPVSLSDVANGIEVICTPNHYDLF